MRRLWNELGFRVNWVIEWDKVLLVFAAVAALVMCVAFAVSQVK